MCGIAGYFGPEENFDSAAMRRMLAAIAHRGPDDEGFLSYGTRRPAGRRAWIGNRRLAIQDLSPAGRQPMEDEATGTALVFNGEVYNFLDLRRQLQAEGERFRSRCDTEVVLRLWSRDGLRSVRHWRGMFGAAVWDPRGEELWLVRDHLGIKPLYYWRGGGGIAFCSEVRGLLATGLIPRRISGRGLEDYLRYGAVQDPVTMIEGVYSLPAGHAMRCSKDGVEVLPCPEPAGIPDTDSREALEPMLREIVRQQMIADVPMASFLSGGVDSSVVSLLAREEAGPDVNTISLVFEEEQFSEAPFARAVAQRLGVRHHEALLRGPEALDKAVAAIGCMDQPSVDGVNSYVVCEAARKLGFTVALSGMGGDEFFGGYGTFRRTGVISTIARAARMSPQIAKLAARVLGPAMVRSGRAAMKLEQYLRHGRFDEHPYFVQRIHLYPEQIAGIRAQRPAEDEADRMAEERMGALLETAASLDGLNQVSFLEARTYMGNMLLRDSDQMSMAHSLELRVPLVDQVLAAWLLRIPARNKGFGREPKAWLRETFADRLPQEVFTRRKMGFTMPFDVWLRGPLRADVEATLQRNPADLWRPAEAQALWRQFLEGRIDWTRPWALYVLSRWAARHVESAAAEPAAAAR